eukprot:NODE_782_length_4275_cov_0.249042.p1 type:complete len:581 gc:universal NODE_782_length_4275_cov_0.249042:3586-1844(-)
MQFQTYFHDNVAMVNNFTSTNIQLLLDYSEILSEMSKIEKEYFTKMDLVLRKFSTKLGKKCSILSGKLQLESVEIPTTNSTVLKAVYAQFNEFLNISNEHLKTSTLLQTKSDVFKLQLNKYEESRKKQIQFHQLILSNKDFQNQELNKARLKYLDACDVVEASNQRVSKADEKLQEKLKKQAEDDRLKMIECKNNYLISVNQNNTNCTYYYSNQVPSLMQHFEVLNHRIIQFLQKQTLNLTAGQTEQFNAQLQCTDRISKELALINIADTANAGELLKEQWTLPADEVFKSTPLWLDTDSFDLQEFSITHLTNIYAKNQDKLTNLNLKNDQNKKELQGLDVLIKAYQDNEKLGDYEDVIEQKWSIMRDYEVTMASILKLDHQLTLIKQQLQDKLVLGNNHTFKSTNFAIPASCEYCKNSIWGKGMQCKLCHSSCHPKCESKMNLNCTKEKKRKGTGKSTENLNNRKTIIDDNRMSISPRSDVSSTLIILQATALYSYTATDESEVNMVENDLVSVIQADNGDGWAEIMYEKTGKRGLVPANYIKISQTTPLTTFAQSVASPSITTNTGNRSSVIANYKCN